MEKPTLPQLEWRKRKTPDLITNIPEKKPCLTSIPVKVYENSLYDLLTK